MPTDSLDPVFDALSVVMRDQSKGLVVVEDKPGSISVESATPDEKGKAVWYGGVQTKKNYVSYHLMAVYANPSLLDAIMPELKKRMQGKSCFNFKAVDDELFAQLGELTNLGFADFSS